MNDPALNTIFKIDEGDYQVQTTTNKSISYKHELGTCTDVALNYNYNDLYLVIRSKQNKLITNTHQNEQQVTRLLDSSHLFKETKHDSTNHMIRLNSMTADLNAENGTSEISSWDLSTLNDHEIAKLTNIILPSNLIDGFNDYQSGDIVWAKIGKYPFWPSIICNAPDLNLYYRKKKQIWFHVRFFSDFGRRAWTKTVKSYIGKEDMLSKYPDCLFSIKSKRQLLTWNNAIKEADYLLKFHRESRTAEFLKTFPNLEDTAEVIKVQKTTKAIKRSLTVPEQDFKMKINGLKTDEKIMEKKKSKKILQPKISFTLEYDTSDSIETSTYYNGDSNLLSDNYGRSADSTRSVCEHKHLEEGKITTIQEICPFPDMVNSEASYSENHTYRSIYLAGKNNKQLFVKIYKKACVVCQDIEKTKKCIGPCQSYFHKECLAKSEERYHKIDSKIDFKNKKNDKNFITNVRNIHNYNKENTSALSEMYDNISSETSNSLSSSSRESSSDYTDENKSSQEISKEKNNNKLIKFNKQIFNNDSNYMCSLCKADKTNCFVCGLYIEGHSQKMMCKISTCGKFYHEKCLKVWPQYKTQGQRKNVQCIICPLHVCHLCTSHDSSSTHLSGDKLIKCIKCPTAYHRSEYCLAAGSQVLTHFDMICGSHFKPPTLKNYHSNAPWCFICTSGGSLICCDLCPSSFHIECLKLNPADFKDGYICEDCYTGRYPLYGEIVWVKAGVYRWWPGKILFPNQVPDHINAIPHSFGEFAVQFFGTYDYYWTNRGKVYNFHEGDDEITIMKSNTKHIETVFNTANIEAAQSHNAYILDKDEINKTESKKISKKPPKYIHIKSNKPIGSAKNVEIIPMNPCECKPTDANPCGPGSNCLNRILMFECQPEECPARDKCNNQRFQKMLYPNMAPFLTKGRGWGLKVLEDIKEGSFIIEYVGDVIDKKEFERRHSEMLRQNDPNYYFLTIDNSRMIDAGPKGNLSRFLNHSCEPNCETQKWTVNGDTRIGLFALHDIPSDTELVFNYRLESFTGENKRACECGTANCSRFIGAKVEKEKKKFTSKNDLKKYETTTKYKQKP